MQKAETARSPRPDPPLSTVNIPEHRKAIDRLDAPVVKLLNERTRPRPRHRRDQAQGRRGNLRAAPRAGGLPAHLPDEQGPMTDESLHAIYREIMSSALSLEKSHDHRAISVRRRRSPIRPRSGGSARASGIPPQKTIADVFAEVSKHRADYGVVPVENSTEGVVTHTLDMFVDSDLQDRRHRSSCPFNIACSATAPVSDQKTLTPTRRRSPNAAAGCRINLPRAEIIETSSNARSAELAAQEKNAGAPSPACWPPKNMTFHPGARHPGQRRQRHTLPRPRPPVQPAHGQ